MIKNLNIFQTPGKTLAFTVINYTRELIAQKSGKNRIHFSYARTFCRRPTSDVNASEQNRCSASVECVLCSCWCTSEACKYSITSAIVMAARWLLAQVQYWALKVLQHLSKKGLWANGGIGSKQKLGISLSKLLKLVNSMKADFLFVGLNLNTIVQEKTPETFTFHGGCYKSKEHKNI